MKKEEIYQEKKKSSFLKEKGKSVWVSNLIYF